jgi:hypothetical protein
VVQVNYTLSGIHPSEYIQVNYTLSGIHPSEYIQVNYTLSGIHPSEYNFNMLKADIGLLFTFNNTLLISGNIYEW